MNRWIFFFILLPVNVFGQNEIFIEKGIKISIHLKSLDENKTEIKVDLINLRDSTTYLLKIDTDEDTSLDSSLVLFIMANPYTDPLLHKYDEIELYSFSPNDTIKLNQVKNVLISKINEVNIFIEEFSIQQAIGNKYEKKIIKHFKQSLKSNRPSVSVLNYVECRSHSGIMVKWKRY